MFAQNSKSPRACQHPGRKRSLRPGRAGAAGTGPAPAVPAGAADAAGLLARGGIYGYTAGVEAPVDRPQPIALRDEAAVAALLPDNGLRPRLLDELRRALYKQDCRSVPAVAARLAAMPGLPPGLAAALPPLLEARCRLDGLEARSRLDSDDGETSHLVSACADGARVETVLMRHRGGRNTVCVSSQAGCAMACRFCATAEAGGARNLEPEEILGQVDFARRILADEGRTLRNVVFMGMGEPLLNVHALRAVVADLVDRRKYMLSRRRLTVSTCGIVPAIDRFADDFPGLGLALSLHAPDDAVRAELMPGAARWSLAELMAAMDRFAARHDEPPVYEYLLIAGLTDRPGFDERLAELLRGRPAKVNLIPFNPIPGRPYLPSPRATAEAFRERLKAAGIPTTIRHAMGARIKAACGQLAGRPGSELPAGPQPAP